MSKFHYRSAFERDLVAWARKRGWAVGERNGVNHLVLTWPATGQRQVVPSSGGGRLRQNVQAQLERIEAVTTPHEGTTPS